MALGVKVAHPDRPVVSLTGDGGFLFGGAELATAVQHGINLVTVLFNNSAYGNVLRDQKRMYQGRDAGSALRNPDFQMFAKSFGVQSWKVTDAEGLKVALKEALAANAPAPGRGRHRHLEGGRALAVPGAGPDVRRWGGRIDSPLPRLFGGEGRGRHILPAEGEGRRLAQSHFNRRDQVLGCLRSKPTPCRHPGVVRMRAGRDGRDPRQASAGAVQQNKMLPLLHRDLAAGTGRVVISRGSRPSSG